MINRSRRVQHFALPRTQALLAALPRRRADPLGKERLSVDRLGGSSSTRGRTKAALLVNSHDGGGRADRVWYFASLRTYCRLIGCLIAFVNSL